LERFFANLLLDRFRDLTARFDFAAFFAFLVALPFLLAVFAFRPAALAAFFFVSWLAAFAFLALPLAAASFTAATAFLRGLGARFLIAAFAPSARALTPVEASSAAASAATSVT
jgi:hypothetical protein